MQVKIRQSKENLAFVQHAKEIARAKTGQIFSSIFHLKASDNNLTITVGNHLTGLAYQCRLETEEVVQEGEAVVDAISFINIFSSLPEEENKLIELGLNKNRLVIKQARRRYTLSLIETKEPPKINLPANLQTIDKEKADLIAEHLEKAYHFCETSDNEYDEVFQHILIKQINDKTLDIVGINSTRGYICSLNIKLPFLNPQEEKKIHSRYIPEIIKFIRSSEEIKADIENNSLYLTNQNQDALKIPLASDEISFPNYKQLCKDNVSKINTIIIFEEDPEPAVKRLIKVTEKQTFTNALVIQPDTEDSVVLRAGDEETGEEKVKVSFQKQPLNYPIGVHIKEFHKILKTLDSSRETIKIGISSNESPICIRKNNDKNALVLIAPVIIEEKISYTEEEIEEETVEEETATAEKIDQENNEDFTEPKETIEEF